MALKHPDTANPGDIVASAWWNKDHTGEISDANHGVRTLVNAHSHLDLSNVNPDQHSDTKVRTKVVDETAIGNDKILVYKTASGNLEYENKPVGVGNYTIVKEQNGTFAGAEAELSTFTFGAGDLGADDMLIVHLECQHGFATNLIKIRLTYGANNLEHTVFTNIDGYSHHLIFIKQYQGNVNYATVHRWSNQSGVGADGQSALNMATANWMTLAFTISLRGSTSGPTGNWSWKVVKIT